MTDPTQAKSQLDKFKEAARALDCDNDEERFAKRMKQIGSYKPVKTR